MLRASSVLHIRLGVPTITHPPGWPVDEVTKRPVRLSTRLHSLLESYGPKTRPEIWDMVKDDPTYGVKTTNRLSQSLQTLVRRAKVNTIKPAVAGKHQHFTYSINPKETVRVEVSEARRAARVAALEAMKQAHIAGKKPDFKVKDRSAYALAGYPPKYHDESHVAKYLTERAQTRPIPPPPKAFLPADQLPRNKMLKPHH